MFLDIRYDPYDVSTHQAGSVDCRIFTQTSLEDCISTSNRAALEYAIDNPLLDAIAVGMQSEEEIDADVAMFEGDPAAFDRLEALRHRERRVMVHDWCEGCGKCAERCRQNAISIVDGRARVDSEKCVFCGYCARACPQFCIKVV